MQENKEAGVFFRTLTTTVLSICLLIGCDFSTQSPLTQEGFVPLARVTIQVRPEQMKEMMQLVRDFCNREKVKLLETQGRKHGRQVYQMEIVISGETFIYGDNFMDEGVFDLRAYSHESELLWKPIWVRITDELALKVRSGKSFH